MRSETFRWPSFSRPRKPMAAPSRSFRRSTRKPSRPRSLVRDHLRAALSADVARWRCRASAPSCTARSGKIAGDLAGAQKLKDETDAAIAGYEKKLADARSNAQSIAGQTRDKLMAEADERRKTLEAKLQRASAGCRKDHRADQDRGDVECQRHCDRCGVRDRRAADRHQARSEVRHRCGRKVVEGLTRWQSSGKRNSGSPSPS